jgi:glutaredoxin
LGAPPPIFYKISASAPNVRKKPSFGDTFFEWIHRYLFHVVIAGAIVFYIWSSMQPQILFANENERVSFFQSLGATPSSRVVVLVTEWCPACKALEANLKAEGLPFIRVDVENSRPGLELFKKAADVSGSNAIPKVIVDRRLVRHSVSAIRAALHESQGE